MLGKRNTRILHCLLLFLTVVLMLTVCIRDIPPVEKAPQQIFFRGQYSADGEQWQPITEKTKLSALSGDLFLKGTFDHSSAPGERVHFYLDHLEFCVSINGQRVNSSSAWEWRNDPADCGRTWHSIPAEALSTEDLVEFHLHNPHSFGNADAYMEFLDSFYLCDPAALSYSVEQGGGIQRALGLLLMGLSLGLIGIAISFVFIEEPLGEQLWSFGILSLMAGVYIMMDTRDLALWSRAVVFNTYMQQLCLMVAAFELCAFLAAYLTQWRRRVARVMAWVQGIFIAGVACLCLMDLVLIYDTMQVWIVLVCLCFCALMVCTGVEWYQRGFRSSYAMPAALLLMLAGLVEAVNMRLMLWSDGNLIQTVYLLLFTAVMIHCTRSVPHNYRKVIRSERMEDEMQSSRILMAMSQIRTHFVFNVLNAISGMCKYDPERADETVVRFSRFLRANIDIMENDQPVSFSNALRHVEDYVLLEQIRFGDKVEFETDITVDRFLIPPLIIQPLVENAIKHGLNPKPAGGTVKLSTRADEENIYVCISDDGVGFDITDDTRDGAVGLNNVRFRLKHMMNGSLEVESLPGQGTKVTVIIPREEAEACT